MIPLLDLNRQTRSLRKPLAQAAARVIGSGQYILGKEVERLELSFARFVGSRHAIGVACGTDALELSLRALGIGMGDLVATVSYTFVGTADAILHVGAQPLFVDIDPKTLTMDPQALEARIQRLSRAQRRRLKAIIPVHLYGNACDMTQILAVAKRHRLKVIEDAAQAAGTAWQKRPVGSRGDLGCFSFFPTKTLGGFGDGGMVVTGSKQLAQAIRSLRNHGRASSGDQEALGRNSRLDALQAALLQVKLKQLPRWIRSRQKLAKLYAQELAGVPQVRLPEVATSATHAFSLFVVHVPKRKQLQAALRRAGIVSQVYYPTPVHRQVLHRKQNRSLRLPATEAASRSALALPIYPELRPAEVRQVCQAIRRFYA